MEKFLVGDEWRSGNGESFESINPIDGSVAATLAQASESDVDDAVRAARQALETPAWRDMKVHERGKLLHRFADLIDQNAETLAQIQTRDNGKTISESRFQSKSAADMFRYFAAVCETTESSVIPSRGNYFCFSSFEPVGVVAAIAPWNSPITLEAQKLAPALAAGNAIVLKSSEVTPCIGLQYGRLAMEAGFPPGILNVVTGFGASVGRALVAHPGVDMVTFTGGTKSGREIAKVAGERLIPCILELGGKSPNIVFDDADIEQAVTGMLFGIFSNAGQSCIAGSRILIQEGIYDAFVARLTSATRALKVGSPYDADTAVAPVSSFHHRDHIEHFVERALSQGAVALCGGSRPSGGILDKGAYVQPTLLEVTDERSSVAHEEIFGPVACVMKFQDEEDLYRIANNTAYGLACGIWTADYKKAFRAARRIKAGTVWVNTYKIAEVNVPFGGFKQSGLGRECGIEGMREYMLEKSTYLNLADGPIPWPPRAANAV
ncbi:aldehyde dehydrogenase family protein [Paraburkholderia xenovorans LB400]|uniref:Betaine-aldehyde dehydrogenase n=1 Tax=Paraburkholderia xenovorans (strain LB400) TaxID=266265 RepID=Q13GB2_PARXL|nr:aldehyde dehydrogenase [Paraburkholderia xenovorans]ABE36877.1 Betaine-aldehyde dehydrogenase [Paraburkholderia xenovorans LB400]AIP34090.1 aldehyde dehydrogenase family protein [Paraburkholderia xenovorans LB400]